MAAQAKIVVLGEANGALKTLFKRFPKYRKRIPDLGFLIVVGNLFGEDDEEVAELLAGRIEVSERTYFTVGNNPLPRSVVERLCKGEDLCENLYYLPKRSTTKTTEGLKIVALGGTLDLADAGGISQEDCLPFHTAGDAKILKGANSADILLTSQWPAHIREGSNVAKKAGAVDPQGDENIAELCAKIRPRYHFSTSSNYFEREPFWHLPTTEAPETKPLTRFVSLAPLGNSGKQKDAYAVTLSAVPSTTIREGCTASPFPLLNNTNLKRGKDAGSSSYPHFGNQHDHHRDKRSRTDRAPRTAAGPEKCFFCIAAPGFLVHLVTSIGADAYLALPKGPLTTCTTNSEAGISFPAHILICPIIHAKTLASVIDVASGENRAEETYAEMTQYRKSLQTMVSELGKGALGAVTYEISRSRNVHVQWQFLPVDHKFTAPQSSTGKSLVEAAFRVEAENWSYPGFQARDPGVGRGEGDFFRVWIWTPLTGGQHDGTETCLTMPLESERRFEPQFGRHVLANLLGLESREKWWDCAQTEEEEKADVAAFKEAFEKYDFAMNN